MSDWTGRLRRLRVAALALGLLAALGVFAHQVHAHYPIQHWLFWRYAMAWLLALVFALSCTSAGFVTLRRLLPRGSLRIGEMFCFSFAVGVVEFFLGMFVFGLLGAYGKAFFFLFPLALIASGAWPLFRYLRRLRRHLRAARRHAALPPALGWVLTAIGLLALALIYFPILNPENAAFDSRWQHLGIAEHYANAGGVVRFDEGWFVATSPHLAAVLYTWAFLLPWSMLFDRVELAAHIELICFLATLPAIVALVRRLVPHTRGRYAWVARFFFPGVLLYDSSLITGADHIAAVFAVPVFLALLFAWRGLEPRWTALFAVVVSGALMTKYTGALLLVAYPLLALGLRAVWLAAKSVLGRIRGKSDAPPGAARRRFDWLQGIAWMAGLGLLITAPHWLKNWVWHGNPVYPLLHDAFPSRPWTVDAAERFELGFLKHELWQPEKTWSGLWQSVKVLLTFSFVPNDWPQFHGKVPVFGSLFTLSLLCLPFARPSRRLLSLFAAAHVGIFAWYWIHHQDRYLQAALPWLAAGTWSVLLLLWRAHPVLRVGSVALVGLQLVWGGDVAFRSAHTMTSQPLKASIDFLAQGAKKKYRERLQPFGRLYQVGSVLPAGSTVLVHESRPRAGLRARAVSDLPGNQGGISYGQLGSPREVWELLRSFGVTHVLYETAGSKGSDSIAGDLVFWRFVARVLTDKVAVGADTVGRLPDVPPDPPRSDRVLLLACEGSGLYRLTDLTDHGYSGKPKYPAPIEAAPPKGRPLDALLSKSEYVAVERRCPRPDAALGGLFQRISAGRKHELWLKNP